MNSISLTLTKHTYDRNYKKNGIEQYRVGFNLDEITHYHIVKTPEYIEVPIQGPNPFMTDDYEETEFHYHRNGISHPKYIWQHSPYEEHEMARRYNEEADRRFNPRPNMERKEVWSLRVYLKNGQEAVYDGLYDEVIKFEDYWKNNDVIREED